MIAIIGLVCCFLGVAKEVPEYCLTGIAMTIIELSASVNTYSKSRQDSNHE